MTRARSPGPRIAAAAAAAWASLLAPLPARAGPSSVVVLGGLTLSSLRTATEQGITSYTGATGGLGFDLCMTENLFVETDALYISRRYAANYTLPTLMFPLLLKFENSFLLLGLGPYVAAILASSSDSGAPSTPDLLSMSGVDAGVVFDGGIKLPLTRNLKAVIELRVSRALTNSYPAPSEFFWSMATATVGLQIPIRIKR